MAILIEEQSLSQQGANMAYRIGPRSDAYAQDGQPGSNKYVDTLRGIIFILEIVSKADHRKSQLKE